jgi:hypothetical protein
VRAASLDVDDEADAAGVMFVPGIVKALCVHKTTAGRDVRPPVLPSGGSRREPFIARYGCRSKIQSSYSIH